MVRFIVVGRRTWRLTLTVAILLGLGSWAFLGDLTRPPWTGEEIRAAWEGVRAWVAERWPGGPEPAPAFAPATVPAAAPVTEARPSGAGPGEVGPGEAGSGGVTRSVAEEAVPVTAPGPGGRVEPVSASPFPQGTGTTSSGWIGPGSARSGWSSSGRCWTTRRPARTGGPRPSWYSSRS